MVFTYSFRSAPACAAPPRAGHAGVPSLIRRRRDVHGHRQAPRVRSQWELILHHHQATDSDTSRRTGHDEVADPGLDVRGPDRPGSTGCRGPGGAPPSRLTGPASAAGRGPPTRNVNVGAKRTGVDLHPGAAGPGLHHGLLVELPDVGRHLVGAGVLDAVHRERLGHPGRRASKPALPSSRSGTPLPSRSSSKAGRPSRALRRRRSCARRARHLLGESLFPRAVDRDPSSTSVPPAAAR